MQKRTQFQAMKKQSAIISIDHQGCQKRLTRHVRCTHIK